MLGWVALNWVTARLIPGTQAQNVSCVALELQDLPPASTLADALAVGELDFFAPPPPAEEDEPELPHATSSVAAATPASTAAGRLTMSFIGGFSFISYG